MFHNRKNHLNRDKVFRVQIYSKDLVSGNIRDGIYQVDIPDVLELNKYYLAVESCVVASEPTTVGVHGVHTTYLLETSLNVPDSYSTSTKTVSRVLCQFAKPSPTANTIATYQNSITNESVGVPLIDTTFLRNKQLQIVWKRCDDVAHDINTMPNASSWSVTLLIYKYAD